ncbi:complex I assembly factor TIMMDC1, mitochondrial [Bombina bombina]|uniref:complex I assembly factor TIMMDC1, mitochondrial n=1 Tax=Bombina bombina TaxID=8345 RepID=UPI00235A5F8D|nr:complex I assembly factor TIMMDC1, mitochondrial [Bombina bombina]
MSVPLVPENNLTGPQGPKSSLPSTIQNPEVPESGWDRIGELFQCNEQGVYPEELQAIGKSVLMGALIGWVYGGVPAARHSKERYIQQSQAEVYHHRVEAVRSAHNAALRGFIRYGWRWSWRVAAFVTIFKSIVASSSLEYPLLNKSLISLHPSEGSDTVLITLTVTGGLFRLSLGLQGLLSGSVIGSLLGIPAGVLISGLQSLSGESISERKRRERRHLYEQKLEEWSARLQVTDDVLEQLDAAQKDSAEKQFEKIQQLLQLPPNPPPTTEDR